MFHSKKPHYAIVNEAVEFGKKFKKESLINAVLREFLRKQDSFKLDERNIPRSFKDSCNEIYSSKKIRSYC